MRRSAADTCARRCPRAAAVAVTPAGARRRRSGRRTGGAAPTRVEPRRGDDRAAARALGRGALERAARLDAPTARAEFWPALLRSCERPAPGWLGAVRRGAPAPARRRRRRGARATGCSSACSRTASRRSTATRPAWPPATSSRWSTASRVPRPGFRVAAARAARRPGHAQALLDAAQLDTAAGGAGRAARPRDRLGAPTRSTRCCCRSRARAGCLRERARRRADARAPRLRGHNDQPYESVGRWLIDQGELRAERSVVAGHPRLGAAQPEARGRDAVEQPARRVLPRGAAARPGVGPRGAQGVPLTPGRSIAVDPQSVPYGTPVWLDTTEPLSTRPLRRLVMAQDTGSADHRRGARRLLLGLGRRRRGAGRAHEAAAAHVGAVADA